MKTIFILLASLCCLTSQAQVPNKFNYQAVARNGQGQALANASVSVRISILDGGATSASVYSETRSLTTNQLGLFTIAIGSTGASSVTGNFATIDWSTGSKFIKVEVDPLGGSSFVTLGNTELLSVPYSLYAVNGKVGPQGATGLTGPIGPTGAQGPPGLTTVTTSSPLKGNGTAGAPITFIAGSTDKQVLLWDAASSTWKLASLPNSFAGSGTKNLLTRWTPDGQTFGNSQIFDDSTKVGVNTSKPTARFEVAGHSAKDTVISPDLSGNSRIVAMFRDTVTNTGNNVGVFTSVGNGGKNVGIYSTSTQSAIPNALYQGLLINNYDNHLVSSYTVEGIYSDVDNIGTGNTYGFENFVHSRGATARSLGIRNIVNATNNAAGIYSLANADNGSAIGITSVSDGFSVSSTAGYFSAYGEDPSMTTRGLNTVADGYSTAPGGQVGIEAMSTSEGTPTEIVDLGDMANPAGLFTADAGSGQGIFAQSIGIGANSLNWGGTVGEAVKAVALSSENVANIGSISLGGNASGWNYGSFSEIDGAPAANFNAAVIGVDNILAPNSNAAIFVGKTAIIDGTEGAGKIFTSDVNGTGSWQENTSQSVGINARKFTTSNTIASLTITPLTNWATILNEDGGANYNTATGEYTITKTGTYQIDGSVLWDPTPNGGNGERAVMEVYLNGNFEFESNVSVNQNTYVNSVVAIGRKLNVGDKVSFAVFQNTGSPMTLTSGLFAQSFSIQFLHK